jgi:hypothetical protein
MKGSIEGCTGKASNKSTVSATIIRPGGERLSYGVVSCNDHKMIQVNHGLKKALKKEAKLQIKIDKLKSRLDIMQHKTTEKYKEKEVTKNGS